MGNWSLGMVPHSPFCPGCAACRPQSPEDRERERAEAEARVIVKRALWRALAATGRTDVIIR